MPPSNHEERLNRIDEKLSKICEKLKKFDDLFLNQEQLKNTLDSLKDELRRIKNDYKDSRAEVADLKVVMNTLQADNMILKKEIKEAKAIAEETAQNKLQNEAIVTGVPKEFKGNLSDFVIKMAEKSNVKLSASDISNVYNLNSNKNNKFNMLKVVFMNTSKCVDFVAAAKKRRLKADELDFPGNSSPIFVNESLTPYKRNLYYEARRFKIEKNYRFVWVKAGKVYLRLSEKEKPILVNSLDDLKILRN